MTLQIKITMFQQPQELAFQKVFSPCNRFAETTFYFPNFSQDTNFYPWNKIDIPDNPEMSYNHILFPQKPSHNSCHYTSQTEINFNLPRITSQTWGNI